MMKKTALVLAAAACGAVMLQAVDEIPAAPASGGEKQAEPAKPRGPKYRVIGSMGNAQPSEFPSVAINPKDPVYAEIWEKRRTALETELNKADADGYRMAGMNEEWIVLERRDAPERRDTTERRRVVLPQGQ